MNLSIEQMREIVSGAPDDTAEFYSGSYWKTEGYGSFIGNRFEGWRRTNWSASTVRHWNMLKLSDLRAAIASHDASITPQDAAATTVAEVPGHDDLIRKFHAASFDAGEFAESGNYNIKLINLEDAIQILKEHGHD